MHIPRRQFLQSAGAVGGIFALATPASSQKLSLREQMLGSWTLTSIKATSVDGKVEDAYGPHGKGTLIFEPNGRYALILVNPDIPKYASNNRNRPTPEEAMAAAIGSFSFFGSYTVDDAGQSFVFEIEASSFANFNGTKQKRQIKAISNSELRFVNLAPPGGGTITEVTYKRD